MNLKPAVQATTQTEGPRIRSVTETEALIGCWMACCLAVFTSLGASAAAADFTPGPQSFQQEVSGRAGPQEGVAGAVQCLDLAPDGLVRALLSGVWIEPRNGRWIENSSLRAPSDESFVFADANGQAVRVAVPWREVKQLIRIGTTNYVGTVAECYLVLNGMLSPMGWPNRDRINQLAVSPDGHLWAAASRGLFRQVEGGWEPVGVSDNAGRAWAVRDVLGVTFDSRGQLWFASRAGVGCRTSSGWKFYEGKDGLPWNDFTGLAAGPEGDVWFSTHLGVIRFDGREWQYREGSAWLPDDDVSQVLVERAGRAWFATAHGLGWIERRPMTLAAKAEHFESEIEHFIKRTPLGYVAEAHLRRAGDRSSADPQDSDNDGLWTAMYGAGECFAYAATHQTNAQERARQAFEALRFLQTVTQGGSHRPPAGYIARTIRPADWPDPNAGRLESDRRAQARDKLWKVYEPRWPLSVDGKWFWKSDTSSDELDGHYFFYGLYYHLCADRPEEKARVREVVRGITDHLLAHGLVLIDHDGRPTRWAIYGPQYLNRDPNWWPERGLNSLSILSYLAVAADVVGDPKYEAASRELIEQHGYAHNAMYPKVQQGPGSGNQSDDEMAFMCYYSLLRSSRDETLKQMIRTSFFRYWANEAPEMNPFFNFAYAAQALEATGSSPFGTFSLKPWPDWHADAMATLYGFSLDRLNWAHRNSHRLDLVPLPRVRARDLEAPDRTTRGSRVNGKVLPVENRHFNHWNTDPWELDYGGSGNELAAGTVFLLPYYMGLYHGFIELPRPTTLSPSYEWRQPHDPDGTGKFYLGREIAQVMGHEGADWLERPEREEEEKPSLLLKSIGLREGEVVADVGAGSGYVSRRLAELVGRQGRVYAVDIQPEMVDLLSRDLAVRRITNVVPVLGTITNVSLPASSLDLAILVDVYHEFSHPFEMMQSICRALKPGGRVVLVEYRAEDPTVPIKRVHKMSEAQVRKEMALQPLEWLKTIEVLPRQHIFVFSRFTHLNW